MDSAWNIFDPGWPVSFRRKPGWWSCRSHCRHLCSYCRHSVLDQQIISRTFRYEQPPNWEAVHMIEPAIFCYNLFKIFRAEVIMSTEHPRYRWFVIGVFFFFMLLHQTD